MASSATERGLENRDKLKQTDGGLTFTSLEPRHDNCGMGKIQQVVLGKFTITGQLQANIPNAGYQSDSAVSVQAQQGSRGQAGGSEESWQRLQPSVECGDDAMTLTVKRRRAAQLLLDRENGSSISLSQLPPGCGYLVHSTSRDLSLMAQYDACHVTLEGDSHVLPLLWRGTPVKVSCPASRAQPQAVGPSSLCCSMFGMTFKAQLPSATEELRVNVRGEWTSLVALAEQCGYTWDRQDTEIVVAAPFLTCGITVKDGKYTLSLQIGGKTFKLACPVSPPEQLPLTHEPPASSPYLITMPESLQSFPWAPPFYLAPPYYPHPTHHKHPTPDGQEALNSPTRSPSTPDPTLGPEPLPPVHYQEHYSHQIPVRDVHKLFGGHSSLPSPEQLGDLSVSYSDLQRKQEPPVPVPSEEHSASNSPSDTGFLTRDEATPLTSFSQFYHYYHHPKIPLPGPPPNPDPGPEVSREKSITNPHNPGYTVSPRGFRQSETLSNVDQFPGSVSYPYTLPSPESDHKTPTHYTPPPPQPYPYHYHYYFPYITKGEVKSLAPVDLVTKTNVSNHQNTMSGTFAHPPPPLLSEPHDTHNPNPNIDQPNPYPMSHLHINSPEQIKLPLLPQDDVTAELDDQQRPSSVHPPLPRSSPPGPDPVALAPPQQPSFPTLSPNPNLHPYLYYYDPYYYYYWMYYGPGGLLSNPSPTLSRAALDTHQTTVPPTESMHGVQSHPLHPFYYYYQHYHQPKVSEEDNPTLDPASSVNSDHGRTDGPVYAAEAGYGGTPQPQHGVYSHYVTLPRPYDHLGHVDRENLVKETKEDLTVNPSTPSASPCGFGPVSESDCRASLGCCSYPVTDCTTGQHLIFKVPDSVVEPSVAPHNRLSELSNVSCTLQRLTSDPNVYFVPLDGCGVNTHVFGQTVVHQLEVHGIHSLQQDHKTAPVRLLVECSSSPGSLGEVRLHVMDQPRPPAVQATPGTVTVQLKVAQDESFTRFYPDAALPLSLLRGRALYVELSLVNPPTPGLLLLVHSCTAYTLAPYASWMVVYDGCRSHIDSAPLPSPRSDIRRIQISSFLSLPSDGPKHLEDPEIYFVCLTEWCSAADSGCTLGCFDSPNSDT